MLAGRVDARVVPPRGGPCRTLRWRMVAQLVAKVFEVLLGETAFEIGAGVDARGSVTLKVDLVTDDAVGMVSDPAGIVVATTGALVGAG